MKRTRRRRIADVNTAVGEEKKPYVEMAIVNRCLGEFEFDNWLFKIHQVSIDITDSNECSLR